METVAGFFDRHSDKWDTYHKEHDFKTAAEVAERGGVNPGDTVLDVGSGTGILIPYLRERGCMDITAVDISPKMTEIISVRYPAARVVTGDYEDETLFAAGVFDKVIIYNAFPHFPHPDKIIANAARNLKPGGIFVIAHSLSREVLDLKHKEVGGLLGSHMLISDEQMLSALETNGFRDIVLEDDARFFLMAVKNLPV